MTSRTNHLTPDQLETFERTGFLVLRDTASVDAPGDGWVKFPGRERRTV